MKTDMNILVERYKDHIFAAAFQICKNSADADDVVQDTFIQYYMTDRHFESEEHIRAWLLRVAINKAKNIIHTFWRRNRVSLEDYMLQLPFETPEAEDLFEEVMHLPEKYRIVIHLFYYEDYHIKEISELLNLSEGAVKVRLTRARKLLKKRLSDEQDDMPLLTQ